MHVLVVVGNDNSGQGESDEPLDTENDDSSDKDELPAGRRLTT
jgi:hypothetical protein